MTNAQAVQYMHEHPENYLRRDGSGKGFVCPVCGSGSGQHGTGITTQDKIHFTCWAKGKANCPESSDIIDIIAAARGISSASFPEKLKAAAEEYGISIDGKGEYISAPAVKRQDLPELDYTSFFLQAAADLDKTDYRRGISLDTLKRYNIGFVKNWTHPKTPNAPASARLIIPTGGSSYVARSTETNEQAEKVQNVGRNRIFNAAALTSSEKPVFVVEGAIDALSIIDAGGEAVALNGATHISDLLRALQGAKPKLPLLISLDNDATGKEWTERIKKELEKEGIACAGYPLPEDQHDHNDYMNADREAFASWVKGGEAKKNEAIERAERRAEQEREELRKESAAYALIDFMEIIDGKRRQTCFSSGFSQLDKILDGGFYPGLYFIGAVSSLGKTTFVLQIADQIAEAGNEVLIFSLEMERDELIAKSISRLTYKDDLERAGLTWAKSTRWILNGTRAAKRPEDIEAEEDAKSRSIYKYGSFAERIFIKEGSGDTGTDEIRSEIEKHIRVTGKRPAVFIDYVQILRPHDIRATDKQNTDYAVSELKRISRDLRVPIIGISSFNRDNYTEPVNMAAFKESGAIEYSSDVLIGLQFDGMDYIEGESDNARKKRVRDTIREQIERGGSGGEESIQVKVLKNRNGERGSFVLGYTPRFNYFTERKDKRAEWTKLSAKNGE